MARSKSKWTVKKKTSQPRITLGREQNAPTAQEWPTMRQYNTFQVSDDQDVGHDFSMGDVVSILPNGRRVGAPIQEHEYWTCRILDVRARNETDVWIRIEWFYSAQDAALENSEFNPGHCGQYERLKSNHTDCVSSSVFNGIKTMKHYDETNLDQAPIFTDEFYYRYTISLPGHSISPAPTATCICGCLYDPSDAAAGSVMHLCPRPNCRKYYHAGCISPSKGKRKSTPTAPHQRVDFLLTDPDTGVALELPLNESASAEPPQKRRRASPVADPTAFSAPIAGLPQQLVRAAAQPLVRGGKLGVAGNVAAVIAARRLVCGALRDGDSTDTWTERMPKDWERTMPPGWDAEALEFQVDGAGAEAGADVVPAEGETQNSNSTVYVSTKPGRAKGAKGKGKGKGKAVDSTSKILSCPGCGGAI
ncbi:hypothetical protein C8R46DRAFT_1098251 [Mycena filopes]|nr:hypothetical protein C8R46DRAFT_1098251 [Mycena filopes]